MCPSRSIGRAAWAASHRQAASEKEKGVIFTSWVCKFFFKGFDLITESSTSASSQQCLLKTKQSRESNSDIASERRKESLLQRSRLLGPKKKDIKK